MAAKLASLVFASLAVHGCTTIKSRITTYLSPDLPFPEHPGSCAISILAETSPDEPLLKREVSMKLERLLSQRGYEIKPLGEAPLVLFAFFTIDSGNTVDGTYNVYVPGGTAYTNVYTSTGQWAAGTTQLPGRSEQRHFSRTYFTRYLGITLYDHNGFLRAPEGGKDIAVVWRSTTTSSGKSSDLRSVIDYLLVGTLEYFGKDTGRQIRRSIFEGDKRVKELRSYVSVTTASRQSR